MKKITIALLMLMISITMSADERMFHISRSINKNWVCYDARIKNGKLDMKDPVHVYWHNNSDNPGHENELSFFQRQMAYGYKVLNSSANEVEYRLTAYKKRSLKLTKMNNHWVSLCTINGRQCVLKEIQVKTQEGNSMKVLYIVLVGKCLKDGTTQKEKINN